MVDRSHESSDPETGVGGGGGMGRDVLGKPTQQIQVSLKELLVPFSQPEKKKKKNRNF